MDRPLERKFQSGLGSIVRGGTWLFAVWALVVVVPLTLWAALVSHPRIIILVIESVFYLCFIWGVVALLQLQRNLRKLGLGSEGRTRLFAMKSRPEDPEEARAWGWGWQFMFAVLAILLCLVAFLVVSW